MTLNEREASFAEFLKSARQMADKRCFYMSDPEWGSDLKGAQATRVGYELNVALTYRARGEYSHFRAQRCIKAALDKLPASKTAAYAEMGRRAAAALDLL
jgi:hypothetical protein